MSPVARLANASIRLRNDSAAHKHRSFHRRAVRLVPKLTVIMTTAMITMMMALARAKNGGVKPLTATNSRIKFRPAFRLPTTTRREREWLSVNRLSNFKTILKFQTVSSDVTSELHSHRLVRWLADGFDSSRSASAQTLANQNV